MINKHWVSAALVAAAVGCAIGNQPVVSVLCLALVYKIETQAS